MATPLIPITLAWLVGIWIASRIALLMFTLGVATIVAVVGYILTWRVPRPRWLFVLALAAILGAREVGNCPATWCASIGQSPERKREYE